MPRKRKENEKKITDLLSVFIDCATKNAFEPLSAIEYVRYAWRAIFFDDNFSVYRSNKKDLLFTKSIPNTGELHRIFLVLVERGFIKAVGEDLYVISPIALKLYRYNKKHKT